MTECGVSIGKRIAERKENPSPAPPPLFLKERISSQLRLNAARVKDNYKINVGIVVNVVIKRRASVERTRERAYLIEKAPQEKQGRNAHRNVTVIRKCMGYEKELTGDVIDTENLLV